MRLGVEGRRKACLPKDDLLLKVKGHHKNDSRFLCKSSRDSTAITCDSTPIADLKLDSSHEIQLQDSQGPVLPCWTKKAGFHLQGLEQSMEQQRGA